MGMIAIHGEVPGPRSRALMRRRELAVPRGVILIPAGTYGNVVRFLTPLTIRDEGLDEGLQVLSECFIAITSAPLTR